MRTHAMVVIENISLENPPGYSSHPLCEVSSVEVLFDPLSFFSQSVLVQSIHVQDVEVYLERRNGLNNTKALRQLIDMRKRARRAGREAPGGPGVRPGGPGSGWSGVPSTTLLAMRDGP